MGTNRVIGGRLAGGFKHGPLRTATRSANQSDNLTLLATAGLLQKQVESNPNADNLWSLGVAQVLLGRFDDALSDLDAALAVGPGAAELHSDLSATLLARAETERLATQDLARAVDSAERALSLASNLVEARFNKAVGLEKAGLVDAAIAAWDAYLALDARSEWAEEARTRLSSLRSTASKPNRGECLEPGLRVPERIADVAARCPQQAREWAEAMLTEWATHTLEGSGRAASDLRTIADLAAHLERRTGDRLLLDTVTHMRNHRPLLPMLARAHVVFERGRILYRSDRRQQAADQFRAARRLFRDAGSSYWVWPQLSLAAVHTHKRELDAALALIAELERFARPRQYRAVLARARWSAGVATLQQSDPSRALDQYHDAADLFGALGERANLSNVMNAAADSERILGDLQRGWASLSTALLYLDEVDDPTRRYLAYYNAALFSRQSGLEFTSLHFQEQALRVARERQGPAGVIEASINQAGILGRLGRIPEAEAALTRSGDLIAQLDDAQPHAYMTARIAATRGEFLIDRDPGRAVRELDDALEHFSKVEPSEVPRLLLLKGRALEQENRRDHAVDTYQQGVEGFEQRLARLRSARERVSYADEGWNLYRRLVEQKIAVNQLDEAVELSDRGRFSERPIPAGWMSPGMLAARLTPDQAVVYYVALEKDLHAWVMTTAGARHVRIPIANRDLASEVSLAVRMLQDRADVAALDRILRRLYNVAVAPLGLPASLRHVIVVPDGPLRLLPFAALKSPTGRFFAQDAAIQFASSLSELMADRGAAPKPASVPRVVVVGDPVIDSARWPHLAPLPHAGREATDVARLYPNALLLTREAATGANILKHIAGADVFHFAGHALANNSYPELSRLIVTPLREAPGELTAADLERAGLTRGAIVVLSACDTASGQVLQAGGVQSLARAFLSLGAGTVVAAAWQVEDFDTSALMVAFHEGLSKGADASSALQSAQLAFIHSGRPLSSWAAFAASSGRFRTQTR